MMPLARPQAAFSISELVKKSASSQVFILPAGRETGKQDEPGSMFLLPGVIAKLHPVSRLCPGEVPKPPSA